MKTLFISIFICFLPMSNIWAQIDSVTHILIVSKVTRDSVALRWAPPDFSTWDIANNFGYTIEKYVLMRDNKLLTNPERAVPSGRIIKKWEEEKWAELVKSTPISVVAAQALYGDDFNISLDQSDIIGIVNKTKENQQRFSLALYAADNSFAVALASGLGWTDKNIERDSKILYRISVLNQSGKIVAKGSILISTNELTKLPPPQVDNVSISEDGIILSVNALPYRAVYSSFFLERSNGTDTVNFNRVSELPHTQTHNGSNDFHVYLQDTLTNITYYRVKGITPFSETGPPSKIFQANNEEVSDIPNITNIEASADGGLDVHWEFPTHHTNHVKTFRLERAEKNNGRFQIIADSLLNDIRVAHDVSPLISNYYRIVARGFDRRETVSQVFFMSLPDTIPPARPTELQGSIDEDGKVKISWKKNEENDMYGYRLYKCHNYNEEPSLVSRDINLTNSASDHEDLKTLNKHALYYVMAIDQNQNHSELSRALKLVLPDKVPPRPPFMYPTRADINGIKIKWRPSDSADVLQYEVFRKTEGDKDWTLQTTVPAINDSLFEYVDKSITNGRSYYYTVMTVDSSMLRSDPSVPAMAKSKVMLKKAVEFVSATADRESMLIQLKWRYKEPGIKSFQIYRKRDSGNGQFTLLKTLTQDDNEWADSNVKVGGSYSYFIVVQFQDLSLSGRSNIASVHF
jgi:fibronectin type 3 domain-containing protein